MTLELHLGHLSMRRRQAAVHGIILVMISPQDERVIHEGPAHINYNSTKGSMPATWFGQKLLISGLAGICGLSDFGGLNVRRGLFYIRHGQVIPHIAQKW